VTQDFISRVGGRAIQTGAEFVDEFGIVGQGLAQDFCLLFRGGSNPVSRLLQ
jgi:hypothetical protein